MPALEALQSSVDDAAAITPSYLLDVPLPPTSVRTPTADLQAATVLECLPYLNGLNSNLTPFGPFAFESNGLLTLQRNEHIEFLHDALRHYPAAFVRMDAARPWMLYWALAALHFLGEDVTVYRERVVKTFFPLQNPTGGYGGGEGHLSHLAGTYAAILSLTLVGGEEAWALTDRRTMWQWLGRLKQPNGSFTICEDGEVDARGAYCALVAISLLNLPWELPPNAPARRCGLHTFGDGLGEWITRCQTYEGGIAAAPGNEAHGAYAFCAVACLSLLDQPERSLEKYLDIDALVEWLSSRQYAPEGGLAGRTNKVVDGCYSHWLGGVWPIVQAVLAGPQDGHEAATRRVSDLYSTAGLARYILNCCQDPEGGLRDKPSKPSDGYHSCYTLAGLSNTEHCHYLKAGDQIDEPFAWVFDWEVSTRAPGQSTSSVKDTTWLAADDEAGFRSSCGLQAVHPVYVVPHSAARNFRRWALQQGEVR